MKHPSHIFIAVGLLLLAIGFTMLDRGWLQSAIPKFGPITHPLAALIALIGLASLLFGAAKLRRENDRADH